MVRKLSMTYGQAIDSHVIPFESEWRDGVVYPEFAAPLPGDVCVLCEAECGYRSWHLMKAVIEVQSADQYCHHLCPNPACGYVFRDVDRSEWPTAANDCCPDCGSSRFKHVAGRLVPRKRCAFPTQSWVTVPVF